jgi:predicted short-subunit dehydrogenase-like oxidoreductase (DUF2520 family)
LRFAEPVRGLAEPAAALAQLVAQGEVALVEDEDAARAQLGADELEVDAVGTEDEAELEVDSRDADSGEAQP